MKEDNCICYSSIFAPLHCFNFLTHHAMDILNLCHCWLRSFSLHLECDGLKSNEIVDGTTIDQFRGCNIIASGGLYIGHIPDPNFKWVAIELVHVYHLAKCACTSSQLLSISPPYPPYPPFPPLITSFVWFYLPSFLSLSPSYPPSLLTLVNSPSFPSQPLPSGDAFYHQRNTRSPEDPGMARTDISLSS